MLDWQEVWIGSHPNLQSSIRWPPPAPPPPPPSAVVNSFHSSGNNSYNILECVFENICPFMRKSICEVRHWCWVRGACLACTLHCSLPQRFLMGLRSLLRVSQLPQQTDPSMPSGTVLCVVVHSQAGTKKCLLQAVARRSEAENYPKRSRWLSHEVSSPGVLNVPSHYNRINHM